jgi:Holliday junction resolvase
MNSSELGTLRELCVCIDLTRRGWIVYRPVNGNADCDIIASKNGKLVKIEVTGGHQSSKDHSKFDILANCIEWDRIDKVLYSTSRLIKDPEIGDMFK